MAIKSLREHLVHELGDVYDAEHRFLEAMRQMEGEVEDRSLKQMLGQHAKQTEQQIKELDRVFERLGEKPKREVCPSAEGIVREGTKVMKETAGDGLKDAAIAGAWSKAEHYEVASYDALCMGAEKMGDKEVLGILRDIRKQEMSTAKEIQDATPAILDKVPA
jgi:ferritin-like metal-binding protein YciE